MRKQGREEHNPMQIFPQATKLGTVSFFSTSVKSALRSHWSIRGQKGLWRFIATTASDGSGIRKGELLAWFYSNWCAQSSKVSYGRFIRDKELEEVLKKLI
jgi:hypothetical protein